MGQEVGEREFSREDRTRYREKIRRCLDVLARMLGERDLVVNQPSVGIEIEFNLVDDSGAPAMRNDAVLQAISDEDFQTELGQFNVEINVAPHPLAGDGLARMEASLRDDLNRAEQRADPTGAHLLMIGILPTLRAEHLTAATISPDPRYRLLSEQILQARGEDIEIAIDGIERLEWSTGTIMPEAACTSTQLHLQVEPDDFAPVWNAAQAIAGVQAATAANAPYLLGRRLWHETRIPLFEQSTDTRSAELTAQGVRPRVFFGDRWITSVFDLFEENVRYFPALLPVLDDEDPAAVFAAGGVPALHELNLHNGTVYRWNRPIYDVVDGSAHLRVENRLLPAGPTVIDTMANAAFFFGLVLALSGDERPVWSQLSFTAAHDNFRRGARHGLDAIQQWPGVDEITASRLVLDHLLDRAHQGLATAGVDEHTAGRFLTVIERRCVTGRTGSVWLSDQVERLRRSGADVDTALARVTCGYRDRMHENRPVHEWDDL